MSKGGDDNYKMALDRMQVLCSKSEKCSGDIKEKLKNYPLNESEISGIIESLKKDKFIDDIRYTNFYCRDKFKFNSWGKNKIRQTLKIKRIEDSIIEEGLSQIDENSYYERVLKLAIEKNKKIKDQSIYSRKGKVFRFLGSKGFESDLIYKAISEIMEDD